MRLYSFTFIYNIFLFLFYGYKSIDKKNNSDSTKFKHRSFKDLNKLIISRLESTLNPNFSILATRTSNSGIFKDFFTENDDNIKILKVSKNKFIIDKELTTMYYDNKIMPQSKKFIITEHFFKIDLFKTSTYYMSDLDIRSFISNDVLDCILSIMKNFTKSEKNKNYTFVLENTLNYDYLKFQYDPIGKVELTKYLKENKVFTALKLLENKIIILKKYNNLNDFISKLTSLLLDQLNFHNVFKNYPISLEQFPDLIPLIFPFKFIETSVLRSNGEYLITYGFDLRNVLDSHLSSLFNKDVVQNINNIGGLFLITIKA